MASLTCLRKQRIFALLLFCSFPVAYGNLPEQGKFELDFDTPSQILFVRRTLYGGTEIKFDVVCNNVASNIDLKIGWLIRGTGCYDEYNNIGNNKTILQDYYDYPNIRLFDHLDYNTTKLLQCNHPYHVYNCRDNNFMQSCPGYFTEVPMDSYPTDKIDTPPAQIPPVSGQNPAETGSVITGQDEKTKTTTTETTAASSTTESANDVAKNVIETHEASETGKTSDKAPETGKNPDKALETGKAPDKAPETGKTPDKPPETGKNPDKALETDKTPNKALETGEVSKTNEVSKTKKIKSELTGGAVRRKRAVAPKKKTTKKPKTTTAAPSESAFFNTTLHNSDGGVYLFVMQIYNAPKSGVKVTVDMKHPSYGYISPIDYPLLVVYGLLCTIYIIYSILWLVLLAMNWKDILRLQYWIAGVIVLGLLEKAVLLSEYDSVYRTGVSVRGAAIFGAIISCFKRALARMLIIIASVGFGIVKPRLGPILNKVLGVGGLYFVLACVAAWYNTTLRRVDVSKNYLYLEGILVVVDAAICWWIFSNLITTLRTLRLRRNIVKHSVYRHFTHTLIVAVLASIGFIIWSILVLKRQLCVKEYSYFWLDEAFWPILFTAILLVIIILWRPTTNNQRYAFSPLLDKDEDDDDDDDVDEIIMNDAYEGMKMRGSKEKAPRKDPQAKADEDLKWVEENIPASIADKALGIDSDEEIKATRFEMGKMD